MCLISGDQSGEGVCHTLRDCSIMAWILIPSLTWSKAEDFGELLMHHNSYLENRRKLLVHSTLNLRTDAPGILCQVCSEIIKIPWVHTVISEQSLGTEKTKIKKKKIIRRIFFFFTN